MLSGGSADLGCAWLSDSFRFSWNGCPLTQNGLGRDKQDDRSSPLSWLLAHVLLGGLPEQGDPIDSHPTVEPGERGRAGTQGERGRHL